MNWFLDVIKNKYATFTGRARRQEFWMYLLSVIIINVALGILTTILGAIAGFLGTIMGLVSGLFGLAILVPTLAIWMRRLHDTGKSGWWLLIGLIPFVGQIVLIVFAVLDSQPGDNQYGPNPKGIQA